MVIGGSLDSWTAMSRPAWERQVDDLGNWCAKAGIRWLTLRTSERGTATAVPFSRWSRAVGGCDVIVDPSVDGRDRFAAAMRDLDPAEEVNEANVAAVLYHPADSEPDLIVVIGPPTRLPPSVVWELAYAELVFVDTDWATFGADDLSQAVTDFGGRRRRFGGLDVDDG
ncbi:MAG: hypothetical protein CSA55_03495 [Ilumatobacter coccineus]|uniref:Ditrans,polycis-undecaprenyl-diphosphate synthase ((2E,6E)-farnesyl-diphosphate specific) n=1 Tax=Ilumatobacter coccineus TaxID=467094 RepID=A0A2G6K9P2_9ACTN|nr:MAG: hypothetical protein CSA55_03495 [Ilumatobacter coccineus]